MADGNTLDTISLEITSDSTKFASGIKSAILHLESFRASIDKTSQVLSDLKAKMSSIGITKISSGIKQAKSSIEATAQTLKDTADRGKESAESVEGVAKATKEVATGASEANHKMGSLAKTITERIKKANPFRNISKGLSSLFNSIKRIAMYRALRQMIKEVAQAVKEGTDNLYQYSVAFNTAFSKNMDKIATAGLYLKNSIGAMISPIINAITPMIDYIVDKVVDALNTINRLIAELTGAETWTRALKYETAYKDGLDDATGSAKKLKATILGIDEINPLNDNSSGGGSASSAKDYAKMFEEVKTTGKKSLNDIIKNFNAREFGQKLSGKLSDAFKWVRDTLEETDFEEIGKKIGEFLEGVDWKELFKEVGQTIWTALKSAIKLAIGVFEANPIAGAILTGIIALKVAGGFAACGSAISTALATAFTSEIAKSSIGTSVASAVGKSVASGGVGAAVTSGIVGDINKTTKLGLGTTIGACVVAAIGGFELGKYIYENCPGIRNAADWLIEKLADEFTKIKYFFGDYEIEIQNPKVNWGEVDDLMSKYNEIKYGKQETVTPSTIIGNGLGSASSIVKENALSTTTQTGSGLGNARVSTQSVDLATKKLLNAMLGNVTTRANGGYVANGDLFLANDGGSNEYIGHIGNNTAVANNDQIVSAVASGVANANSVEVSLLREQNALLSKILAKDGNVTISTGAISNGLSLQNKINGVSTVAFS